MELHKQMTTSTEVGLKQLFNQEDGVSFIECALLVSLIAVVGGIAVLAISKL